MYLPWAGSSSAIVGRLRANPNITARKVERMKNRVTPIFPAVNLKWKVQTRIRDHVSNPKLKSVQTTTIINEVS